MSLAHAQENTLRLLDAVIDAAPDLELSGLEGDAAFLYATEPTAEEITRSLAALTTAMHAAFHTEQGKMETLSVCRCDACHQTGRLNVKVVAHYGEVVLTPRRGGTTLAGVDVILVHRMLKNSVPVDEYVLMTEAVRKRAGAPFSELANPIDEELEGLGVAAPALRGPGRGGRAAAGARTRDLARADDLQRRDDRADSAVPRRAEEVGGRGRAPSSIGRGHRSASGPRSRPRARRGTRRRGSRRRTRGSGRREPADRARASRPRRRRHTRAPRSASRSSTPGASRISPWPASGPGSKLSALLPASRIARVAVGRLTTVARTVIATSSSAAAPAATEVRSWNA